MLANEAFPGNIETRIPPQVLSMAPTAIAPIAASAQNEPDHYRHFSIQPISGALGAEMRGVDLGEHRDCDALDEVHQALLRHKVVVLRGQHLTPSRLVEMGRYFGDLHVNPFVKGLDGHPEVMPVRAEENHEKQFTGLWHSDISWAPEPSMGSLLYAVELPTAGGDTLFANLELALSSLSPRLQQILSRLRAEHRVDRHHRARAEHAQTPRDEVLHPVVTRHPQTDERILFVNEYFTTRFENMSEAESEPLLGFLFQHIARPDFSCRVRWEPGTLVFWDNRNTQHYATNDYPGQKRLMHRVTIAGQAPSAAEVFEAR